MNKVAENPSKNRTVPYPIPLVIVSAVFVTLYLVSNIMAVKIVGIGKWIYFDAGTITFPFAYMLGDVLTEIWGYKTAKRVILLTLACNILLVLCTWIGVFLPVPDYNDAIASAYNRVFTYVPRLVLGSIAGFLCGELSNAWLMVRIKKWTEGRLLWVRAIGSSIAGHLFDTVPFVLIAFGGVVPWIDILKLIAFQFVAKLGIEAIMGTPLAYLILRFMRRFGIESTT